MIAVFGILVIFGAVLGGFLMEKGHAEVLLQPAEPEGTDAGAESGDHRGYASICAFPDTTPNAWKEMV
jgi:hypothetical protein